MAGEDVTISIGGSAAGAAAAATQANASLGSIVALLDSLGVAASGADNRMAVLARTLGQVGNAGGAVNPEMSATRQLLDSLGVAAANAQNRQALLAMSMGNTGQAAAAAGAALQSLQGAFGSIDAGAQSATDALNQLTASMQQAHQVNLVMADALATLGPEYATDAAEFLNAASSADDYSARLAYLQAQIQLVTDAQQQQNAAMSENATGASLLSDAMGGLSGMVQQTTSMFMGMFVLQTITGMLNDATTAAENFGQAMFDLNNTVQKEQTSWGYLLGGGGQTGINDASQLMNWSKTASYGVPYTRQDMLQAMTNLMTMPGGLGNSQIEQYLPILADIGATRAPNQSLAQITQAIMGAEMGYSRMLRYDLHINPADLEKYGLQIKKGTEKIENPDQLLPALEGWANANGYGGAAQKISTTTWWGEWSSFIDRIQNFQLTAGGSMFKDLQTDLNNLSAWMDKNAGTINTVATDLGNLVGAVVHLGTVDLGSLFKGLQDSGAGEGALKMLNALTGLIGGNGAEQSGKSLFYTIGHDVGGFVSAIAGAGPRIQQFAQWVGQMTAPLKNLDLGAFKNVTEAWKNLMAALTPGDKEAIKTFLKDLAIGLLYLGASGPLAIINGIALALNLMALGVHELNGLWNAGKAGVQDFGLAMQALGQWLGQVGGDIGSTGKRIGDWFASLPGDAQRELAKLGKGFQDEVGKFTQPFETFGHWLYDHNYYVKDIVDAWPRTVANVRAAFTGALHDYEGMFEATWHNIQTTAQRDWGLVETDVVTPVQRAFGWVEQRAGQARAWLQGEWNTVDGDATKAWQRFETAISGEVHTVEQDVQAIVAKITDPINKMINWMHDAGRNAMKELAQGLKDGKQWVFDQIGDVAGKFAKMLGFHSPTEEGPGHDADVWMPNMMRMLAGGIEQHIPTVAAASQRAAASIHNTLGGYGGYAVAGGGGGSTVNNSTASYSASAALGGVHIYGANSEEISAAIAESQKSAGEQANLLLRQPGGFRQFGQVGSR